MNCFNIVHWKSLNESGHIFFIDAQKKFGNFWAKGLKSTC